MQWPCADGNIASPEPTGPPAAETVWGYIRDMFPPAPVKSAVPAEPPYFNEDIDDADSSWPRPA